MTRKTIGLFSAGLVLLILIGAMVILLIGGRDRPGVNVLITNNSLSSLTDLHLEFTGGKCHLAKLEASQTRSFVVKPKGESHLVLSFSDVFGKRQTKQIDIYMESGYTGKIEIGIDGMGELTIKDQVQIGSY